MARYPSCDGELLFRCMDDPHVVEYWAHARDAVREETVRGTQGGPLIKVSKA